MPLRTYVLVVLVVLVVHVVLVVLAVLVVFVVWINAVAVVAAMCCLVRKLQPLYGVCHTDYLQRRSTMLQIPCNGFHHATSDGRRAHAPRPVGPSTHNSDSHCSMRGGDAECMSSTNVSDLPQIPNTCRN